MPQTARRGLLVAGLGVLVAAFLSWAAVRRGFFDLNVYYGALNYWVHEGGQLYDYVRPRTEYGFTYPPFAALTMLPMALVPWPLAIVISSLLTIGAAVVMLYWLVTPMARREGWPVWVALSVAAILAAAFEPMRETFSFGQVNAVLLVLVLADFVLLLGRGSRLAGVGIGLHGHDVGLHDLPHRHAAEQSVLFVLRDPRQAGDAGTQEIAVGDEADEMGGVVHHRQMADMLPRHQVFRDLEVVRVSHGEHRRRHDVPDLHAQDLPDRWK